MDTSEDSTVSRRPAASVYLTTTVTISPPSAEVRVYVIDDAPLIAAPSEYH
jgi:hypothetical protein